MIRTSHLCRAILATAVWGVLVWGSTTAFAQKIQLDDGRIYEGRVLPVTGVADPPLASVGNDEEAIGTPILLIDDELRRVFVPKTRVTAILEQVSENLVKITPWQKVAKAGSTLASVGPSLGVTPFDKWGRRTYEMQTRNGPLAVVQGITELTARYAKVEGLLGPKRPIVWDMRLATSNIPRDTLAEILEQSVSHKDPKDWLQVVRFYLQAERFSDALKELNRIIAAFPAEKDLASEIKQLRRLGAERILREIELRHEAGQYELVLTLLENFPTDDVSGETLQRVRETLADYQQHTERIKKVAGDLRTLVSQVEGADTRALMAPVVDEIIKALNPNNIDRLAPFAQLADDEALAPERRVALAISGWLLGATNAEDPLNVALNFVTVRQAVREYLREPLAHKRAALLEAIQSLEGVTVPRVASLLANLAPPLAIPAEAAEGDGSYRLTAPGRTEHGDFTYYVQLPSEYDPYRRYPLLLVLNGAYNTPLQELEFWAGTRRPDSEGNPAGPRQGQARRHGYITLAVDWLKPRQYVYEFSLREHEAVLTALRDACRRFNIDTDRVYLSGHGIGGEAAWDIALAHPDLWAGAVPFVAQVDSQEKFIQHYWENAEFVPLYFVAGELDGTKMKTNAIAFDRYLTKRFDTTVVEFRGRGYEPFYDEIHQIFDWCARQRRSWPPQEFECNTMRQWDNFFWWVEGRGFDNAVTPGNWPRRSARPTLIQGSVRSGNRLVARTACDQTILWLSPEVVDFTEPIRVTLNGNRLRGNTTPSLGVLLEDARTRVDRQRPFWAKLQVP